MSNPQYPRKACKPHPPRLLGFQTVRPTKRRTQGARHTKDDDEPHKQSTGKQKNFPQEVKTVNSLHMTKGKNRAAPIEVRATQPIPEESRHWLLKPITFDHQDYSRSIQNPGWNALILDPIIDGLQFTQVLMDGGSNLNLLYPDTIRKLG